MADLADPTDPCAVYAYLAAEYYRAVAGGSVKVNQSSDGRRVEYATADIAALRQAMMAAQAQCLIQQGKPPQRFAIGSSASLDSLDAGPGPAGPVILADS
jgi:hypothetical protein